MPCEAHNAGTVRRHLLLSGGCRKTAQLIIHWPNTMWHKQAASNYQGRALHGTVERVHVQAGRQPAPPDWTTLSSQGGTSCTCSLISATQ